MGPSNPSPGLPSPLFPDRGGFHGILSPRASTRSLPLISPDGKVNKEMLNFLSDDDRKDIIRDLGGLTQSPTKAPFESGRGVVDALISSSSMADKCKMIKILEQLGEASAVIEFLAACGGLKRGRDFGDCFTAAQVRTKAEGIKQALARVPGHHLRTEEGWASFLTDVMTSSFADDWLDELMDNWQFVMGDKEDLPTYYGRTAKFLYSTKNVAEFINGVDRSIETKFIKRWLAGMHLQLRSSLALSVKSNTTLEKVYLLARKVTRSLMDGTQGQELADMKRKMMEMEGQKQRAPPKRHSNANGDVNVTLNALVGQLGGQDEQQVLAAILQVAQNSTRLCFDWQNNRCARGSSCKFSHDGSANANNYQPQQGFQPQQTQQPQQQPQQSQQPVQQPTTFLLPPGMPPSMPPPGLPPGMPPPGLPPGAYRAADDCRGFQRGKCTKGVTCPFSHPPDHMPNRATYCFDWKNKKSCARGSSCPWAHIK